MVKPKAWARERAPDAPTWVANLKIPFRGDAAPNSAGSGTPGGRSVAVAVAQFAISGLAAVAVLGFVAVQLLQSSGRSAAIAEAKRETRLAGQGIVAPEITTALLAGGPRAIARMDRTVRARVLRDPVNRIKIWDANGRVIYSDEHRLIGSVFGLGPSERRALRAGGSDAGVSNASEPENRFERGKGKLLEVYQGIRGPQGQRLLFEDYLRYSAIAASGRQQWLRFAPALIITLILLELAQIPLAWSLARRLRRGQAEREALLKRAIEASELERRRIAGDLHDGVVQNLAGVSYTLSAAAEGFERRRPGENAEMVRQAATEIRHSIRELRTLLVDIYPPTLRRAGLEAALSDLMAPLKAREIETELEVQAGMSLPAEGEPLLYRAAQEALRNAASHADPEHVRVAAQRQNGRAVLSVEDDGRGFDSEKALADASGRHFGLRILRDLARDAGGELTVESEPGHGTQVRIEVPVT